MFLFIKEHGKECGVQTIGYRRIDPDIHEMNESCAKHHIARLMSEH